MKNTLKPLPDFTEPPSSDKTVITLDREEAVRFAETLLAAARKPTTAMIHAAHDYNDSVVEHCDFCDKPDVFQKGLCPICFEDHYGK